MSPISNRRLSHIASGLFPAASFVALPTTPIPEPESKNKPGLKPSPLYGALIGASNLSRSIGGVLPSEGTARSLTSMYDSIDSTRLRDDVFARHDDDDNDEENVEVDGDRVVDDDDDDDDYEDEMGEPGYSTIVAESASESLFPPRQRLLTPPSPVSGRSPTPAYRGGRRTDRDNDDDFRDDDDDVDDELNNQRDGRNRTSSGRSTASRFETIPKSSVEFDQPSIQIQSRPIYAISRKASAKKAEDAGGSTRLDGPYAVFPSVSPTTNDATERGRRMTDEELPTIDSGLLLEELRSENAELKRESMSLNRLVESLQRRRLKEDCVDEELSALRDVNDALRKRNDETQTKNYQLLDRIATLERAAKSQLEDKQRAVTEMIHERRNEEMRKEIASLQKTIQRLSVELSQAQIYSDALARKDDGSEEKPEGMGDVRACPDTPLDKNGPCPSWLVNTKYLSPLIAAYDEKLSEKDKILLRCRDEVEELRSKMGIMKEENTQWRTRLEKMRTEERQRLNREWTILENHNQLMIRENQVLMSQIALKEKKATALMESAAETEGRLRARVDQLETELDAERTQASCWREKAENLREKLDAIIAEDEAKMSIEEHVQQLQDLKKLVAELKEKHSAEKDALLQSRDRAEAEVESLRKESAELRRAAEEEGEMATKVTTKAGKLHRKLAAKCAVATRELAATRRLQEETEARLEDVCSALETSQADNKALATLLESESEERNRVLDGVVRRSADIGQWEERLAHFRDKVGDKLVSNASKMQKLDLTYTQHRIEYRNRVKRLMRVIEAKDKQIIRLVAAVKDAGLEYEWELDDDVCVDII